MINRLDGKLVICCDFCSDEDASDTDDFTEAWGMWKDDGWRAFKEGGEWQHKCPNCIEDRR
jgi:hypothetical protein